jgi:hypothetical protein
LQERVSALDALACVENDKPGWFVGRPEQSSQEREFDIVAVRFARLVLHPNAERVSVSRKMHDVRTVVVKSVQEVVERRGGCVLDDNEVAILRSSQSLLDLPDLLIYAQPRPLPNDRAIWAGHRRLDRVGISSEVQDSEWFRSRGPDLDVADLRERRARRRDSPRVGDLVPTTAGVVSSSSAVRGLPLGGFGCTQRGCFAAMLLSAVVMSFRAFAAFASAAAAFFSSRSAAATAVRADEAELERRA